MGKNKVKKSDSAIVAEDIKQESAEIPENDVVAEDAESKTTPITLTQAEFDAVKERIDKLQEERDDAVHQAQRLQAEFENYRKRNALLASESRDDGAREILKQLLPVLDNFDRALEKAEDTAFAKGVCNISRQFKDILVKCGLEELPAEGVFDPNLHEAVMQDSVEGVESGIITAVLQKGYRVKGRIVRHTMVKVNS